MDTIRQGYRAATSMSRIIVIGLKQVVMTAATIVSVEEFFYDDPNTPWKPLPEHDLKSSPCYPIID
jgi:hypothetical protein